MSGTLMDFDAQSLVRNLPLQMTRGNAFRGSGKGRSAFCRVSIDCTIAASLAPRLCRSGEMNNLLFEHGSYVLITLFMILTGAGLPLPEEVGIIAAGTLSGTERLYWPIALGCCLFGALVGDCLMYWLGYHFGRGVLREQRWFARFITPDREAQIEEMFCRHGLKVFFVARFLVGLRSPVYLTAGILRVSFRRFVLIDLVCATAVVGTFFGLTYYFGANVARWAKHFELWLTIAVALASACVAFLAWRHYRRRRRP
jgi:membrane protein DedA with SNARE-associated domain